MRALQYIDGAVKLIEVDEPEIASGEALVRVVRAGVCNTDIEITRGYFGYSGTLGHEFVGVVERSDNKSLLGKRVVADINCACGGCDYCMRGDGHHCPERTVLGIVKRNGAFADKLSIPESNLVAVPDAVPDEVAVFAEPVAAALEIQEQLELDVQEPICVIGDGKLGLLIAMSLDAAGFKVDLVGRHPDRRKRMPQFSGGFDRTAPGSNYSTVVEATGNPEGFKTAVGLTRPRGTLVLKSTYASGFEFNPAMVVVNEIKIQGSRCGPMDKAVQLLKEGKLDPSTLIDARYSLGKGVEAMEEARASGVLKVVLDMESP